MRAALTRKEYTRKLLSEFQTERYRTAYEDACKECAYACGRLHEYYSKDNKECKAFERGSQ